MRPKTRFSPTLSGAPAAMLVLLVLLSGCEFFSTKDFSPRPGGIRTFAGTFDSGVTVAFRVTEYLRVPGSKGGGTDRTARIVHFVRAPDSLQRGDGWTTLLLTVSRDSSKDTLENGLCHLRFDSAGVVLQSEDSTRDGTARDARYFPLKVAAGGGAEAGGGADSGTFLSLPSAFILGASWLQSLGALTVSREIEDLDTLGFGGHLEESWRIAESVKDGNKLLARGSFWYGASGLLKGEQTWEFEGRSADGTASATKELRRELVRL